MLPLRAPGLLRRQMRARVAFAGQCEICRGWGRGAVCDECLAACSTSVSRCERCGLALATAQAICGDCLRVPPPYQSCCCGVDYSFPWDRLIGRFKFNGQVELSRVLCARLLRAVQQRGGARPELLLPVPLSLPRLAERGYNQSWLLTRRLSKALAIDASATLLQRPVDTAHQAGLPLARRRGNLRGAFIVDAGQRQRIEQRHVALIDDVMTSGATLREATTTLLRAGAKRVDVWVLARTPAPPPPR
jgi:ComF family protein